MVQDSDKRQAEQQQDRRATNRGQDEDLQARQEPPRWARILTALLWTFVFFSVFQLLLQSGTETLSYDGFKDKVSAGQVTEVVIEGHQVKGMMTPSAEERSGDDAAQENETRAFQTHVPEVGETRILDLLEQNDVSIVAKETGPSLFSRLLISFLPWLLILGIIVYFWQRMQRQSTGQNAGGLFSMGKSRAKRFRAEEPGKTFDDIAGAENDIEQATKLARRMVSRWGMSDAIGPVAVSASQEEVFLGQEISRQREHSEATAETIDREVRKLITEIERDVSRRLRESHDQLERLANRLLEVETLDATEIDELLGSSECTQPSTANGGNTLQQKNDPKE